MRVGVVQVESWWMYEYRPQADPAWHLAGKKNAGRCASEKYSLTSFPPSSFLLTSLPCKTSRGEFESVRSSRSLLQCQQSAVGWGWGLGLLGFCRCGS